MEADYLELRKLGTTLVNQIHTVKCKICGENACLFDVVDFNRVCRPSRYLCRPIGVPVYFHRCDNCHFVFTCAFDGFDSDAWRRHIYNDQYYQCLDPDYKIARPKSNSEIVHSACSLIGKKSVLGIDYGGGNGAMSRILNDQGIKYFTHDPHGASNIEEADTGEFNFLSSFEVLEHTVDPLSTMREMLSFVGPKFVAIMSTQCSDDLIDEEKRLSWSYVAPRNGHVSIYSQESLRLMAKTLSLDYVRVSRGTHLFGRSTQLKMIKYAIGCVKVRHRCCGKFLKR